MRDLDIGALREWNQKRVSLINEALSCVGSSFGLQVHGLYYTWYGEDMREHHCRKGLLKL